MNGKKGLFITLEGGEGSGKSTQIRMLKSALENAGHSVVTTREPGGTPDAEKIRDLLVQRDGGNWSPMAECLLLFAARHMHYNDLIAPAIARGEIVISDRFTDSTRAYQGYGMGLAQDSIETVKFQAIGAVEPDLTFILDIPAEEGLNRSTRQLATQASNAKESAEDRYERLGIAFHETLRQGFLLIARAAPQRCRIIDALQDTDAVHHAIMNEIRTKLAQQAKAGAA